MINRSTLGKSCWHYAIDFLEMATCEPNVSLPGAFITGQSVPDVLDNLLDPALIQQLQHLEQKGLCFLVCHSRIPDSRQTILPAPFRPGTLGQWMEWVESADKVVEWT